MKRAWAEPKENNCDAAQLCTRGNPDALVRSESTQKKTRSFVPGYGELATCFSVQNLNVQLRSIVFCESFTGGLKNLYSFAVAPREGNEKRPIPSVYFLSLVTNP
jgi:hypothetical protein